MAKDLRGLLEPATASSGGNSAQISVPLAQRRSLSSPGEPRVFRVRSGFVCGLCGRLHVGLEKAFDCLGRCTIELRLRTPAGPSQLGGQAHFACTACGRGFVNSDDAEQCFERCLGRMKPHPQFEQALRRVQVRYAQRLASHGVRELERIDPLAEHTKMLTTLTKERAALGHGANTPTPPQRNFSEEQHTVHKHQKQSTEVGTKTSDSSNEKHAAEARADEMSFSSLLNSDEINAAAQIDLESNNYAQATVDDSSALSEVPSATPESHSTSPKTETDKATNADELNPNITDTLSALDFDELGSVFVEAPEFASVAEQPENEYSEFASVAEQPENEASMGADVLALLQGPSDSENLGLNTKQEKIIKDNKIEIDEDLLEAVTSSKDIPPEVGTIFTRTAEMKPYRRNNAKYACSACTREFFTNEQVEACFYSHPEEGSEEERVLREKIEKSKANSAA